MDAQGETEPDDGERSLRSAAILTASVGALHAILFLVAFWLLSAIPAANAPNDEIREFYLDEESRRILVTGLYLIPFAGIAFVWFIVALRMWIDASVTSRRSVLHSNLQLVSGILYIAVLFAGGAAYAVLGATLEVGASDFDPATGREFPVYGGLLFVFAMRLAAMFVITTCAIGRRSGILPRWFSLSGYAVGLVLLISPSLERWMVLVFPLWLLAFSILLFIRARRIDPAAQIGPGGRRSWFRDRG